MKLPNGDRRRRPGQSWRGHCYYGPDPLVQNSWAPIRLSETQAPRDALDAAPPAAPGAQPAPFWGRHWENPLDASFASREEQAQEAPQLPQQEWQKGEEEPQEEHQEEEWQEEPELPQEERQENPQDEQQEEERRAAASGNPPLRPKRSFYQVPFEKGDAPPPRPSKRRR